MDACFSKYDGVYGLREHQEKQWAFGGLSVEHKQKSCKDHKIAAIWMPG